MRSLALEKLAYLKEATIDGIAFKETVPDKRNDWLDQSLNDLDTLIPLLDKQTKFAKIAAEQQAVFRLYALGCLLTGMNGSMTLTQ